MKKTSAAILLILLLSAALSAGGEEPLSGYRADRGWTFVSFGRTAQDRPEDKKAILWRVLSADEEKALLLSENILASKPVQSGEAPFSSWESSSLYAWLNGDFAKTAFSSDEQAALLYQDDLSLVSLPEKDMLEWMEGGSAAKGTAQAVEAGLYVSSAGNTSPYWTRSAGPSFVNAMYRVQDDGTWSELYPDTENIGVRPVVALSLQDASILSGTGTEEAPYVLTLPKAEARAPRLSPTPRPTQTPAPVLTPVPTEAPAPIKTAPAETETGDRLFPTEYGTLFPELTEEGFLPEGEAEFVWQDPEGGVWLYASQDLRIEILRREDTSKRKKPKRWLEAEIFVRRGAEQQTLQYYFSGQKADTEELADELDIAKENSLVFAVNGDWYYYRAQQNEKKRTTVGVILRQGLILADDPGKKDVTTLPTRDILALYQDGRMEPYDYNAAGAEELLKQGVYETLCFGPILVEDGEITAKAKKVSARQAENPRCGVGRIGPGHFLAVVAEGGTKQSVGMKLEEFAALFANKNCRTAINLNGGPAAQMMFMGTYVSENKSGAKNRQQNEVLGIGQSAQVVAEPAAEEP